jgi:hypothetical protein
MPQPLSEVAWEIVKWHHMAPNRFVHLSDIHWSIPEAIDLRRELVELVDSPGFYEEWD